MFYSMNEIVYSRFQTFISSGVARRAEYVKLHDVIATKHVILGKFVLEYNILRCIST